MWNDEYWLLIIQLFLKKPEGVKPIYCKDIIDLSLSLHIEPKVLYRQMFSLRNTATPSLVQMLDHYRANPRQLKRDAETFKTMNGYGNAKEFYRDVDVKESFEHNYRPLKENPQLTPMMLIIILDLYFQLTPSTMVPETDEIKELAKLMNISPALICNVMDVYKFCDPYLNREDFMIDPLLDPCMEIWDHYGNEDPQTISALALQMKEYFR